MELTQLQTLDAEIGALVDRVRLSLVQVSNGRRGAGAGTIWHPDGLIVTNAHVVKLRKPEVTLSDGRKLPARLLVHDLDLDLAALAVDEKGLPSIELGESTGLRAGELVFALGHPWGIEGAVTAGVVIGVGSEWEELPRPDREWIAASLSVRPGHSGGPMVDARGRLVGINTMMAGSGVGVAVPVHVAKRFLKDAIGALATGRRR